MSTFNREFTKEQLIASAHARIEFAEMMLAGELEPLKERTWSIELELARIALASLEAEAVPEWTNEQCMEFLSIAFRHAEINGDLQLDDIRLGVKMVNGSRAAMLQGAEPVSNRDELPLGYLQGHKDGLEWAAQLAEANHPQTGDWLYDDPIELAKAIRKGPDMPEADGNSPVIPDEKGSSLQLRNLIRQRHAEWSQATFGDVGPVGPLKHLSKEALEAAAEPEDLSEWADMQFLLWDAQRRAGISDGEITAAMEEKLKVNVARQWPEPKDGEPRLHIKAAPQQEVKP